jgi:uncharacterized membrane protein
MSQYLLYFLAPGEKFPPGATDWSLSYEGLSWGWAFFAFLLLVALVTWSYYRYAPNLSRFSRFGFIVLRSLFLGLLLILLTRPVLLIKLEETIRRPLLVLLDNTQSMGLADHRSNPDDLARAALAVGLIDPAAGLKQSIPDGQQDHIKQLPRRDLLEALAANPKLNLWPRLQSRSSLEFYGFGRKLAPLGELAPSNGTKLTTEESAAFFHGLHYDENLTAVGDSLRELLDEQRGQPISGILLITDGASNTGSSPVEAAAIAKQDGVPLYIYGVGIASPIDIMVAELSGPQVSNVKEKLTMTVHIRALGMVGRKATVQLKANGKVVDEQPIEFRAEGEQEINLSYTPDEVGMVDLEAYVPPLPEEAVRDNNSARTQVRIVDDKIKVLLVQEEPSWDFAYLLEMLQRDRRIKLKCVLLKGDPDLSTGTDSPFLDKIPDDQATLFANDVVILGDVDPADLGDTRMKLLNDWVSKMGGGLLFYAGPNFDPTAYHDTPLESILPVETETKTSDRYPDPVQLKLTSAGETSPLLMLSQDPQENLALWGGFPGVNWTAWVDKAHPGAQVLMVDPTPSRANQDGPMPVIAQQSYGLGQSLYLGFMETYRWRSKKGEKYYTQIWGQIIQALASQHILGASALTQLKTDRTTYFTGDKIKLSGRIFQTGLTPLSDAEVPGTLTIVPEAKAGQPASAPQTKDVRLQMVPDRPGEYRAETVATTPGTYSYTTARDPAVTVKFQVMEPQLELSDIAMNEKGLRAMAAASGGHFLREEDLNGLPELVASQSANSVSFKKIPLALAPIVLGLMILIACAEWLWRRKLELK